MNHFGLQFYNTEKDMKYPMKIKNGIMTDNDGMTIEMIEYNKYVWFSDDIINLKAELFNMAVAAEPTPKKTSKNERIRELAYALEYFTQEN